jgi:hypothetical protein
MNIKKKNFDRIVREESAHWIGALLMLEKARENDEKDPKKPDAPKIQGADKDSQKKDPKGPISKEVPGKPGPSQKQLDKPKAQAPMPPEDGPEDIAPPEMDIPDQGPEDDALAADAADDSPEDPKEKASQKISDVLVGKTIQSVSEDPESKILPGASEIVITFDQITDPLKILVTKTGKRVYWFRGSVHNML